ncbi:DUF1642 domain-containing protein, partial [Lactococcus lactis subsp. lactis]|nr:DUF1642 domain-containing protein [Lactococcus lactis subsp. lactis]
MAWRTRKMTKFEEKLEILPIKTIQHPVGDTKYYTAIHVKTLIAQADEEIATLKSQLQQQALPVVPDFIGKLINTFGAPEDGKHINYSASYLENQKELDWIDNHQKTWLTALLIGFMVEKPQLFYLRDELTGQFLAKDNQFKNEDRYFFWNGADPLTHSIGTAWKLTF